MYNEKLIKPVLLHLKPGFLVAAFCFLSLAFAGCDSPKSEENSNKTTEKITSERDLSAIKVGYCTPSLNAPFYVVLNQAIKTDVERYGMTFLTVDGQADISKQVMAIEDLIARGVDVLIVNPLDPKALIPTVNAASKAGISVFIVDSFIEPKADYITSVLADNQLNGELIGEWVAGKMANKKINAAIISGAQGNPVGKEKRLGFIRGLAESQLRTRGAIDFQVVSQGWGNWSNTGGLKAMEDILVTHPNLNVLLAENDAMAMGAQKAINEAGKSGQILVTGFDGQKEAYELIKQGKYGATAQNNPKELGRLVVESAVKHLNGEKNLPKIVYTNSVLVDKDKVNEYYDPKSVF